MTILRIRAAHWLLLTAALCASLTGTPVRAQEKQKDNRAEVLRSSPQILAAFREVVAGPSQCTVRVCCDGKDAALGTIVGPNGWILTKASELKGKIVCKLKDGRELEGHIVGVHDKHDLALLKIKARGLKPVDWAESKTAPVGNWLASPGTGAEPVAIGVVSVAARTITGRSGPRNPSTAGFLGVSFDPEQGRVKIMQVIPGSGAAKAGLKVNDLILGVAGKMIENQEGFQSLIANHRPGDVIDLRVKRGDQELELKATLGKRPPNRGDYQNSLGSTLSDRRGGFAVILQHDSVIRPSDCGGPCVDLDGKAIGINIARAGRTETYAVPTEAVLPVLLDLMSGKMAPDVATAKPPQPLSPAEKVAAAKAALQRAEAERAAAEKKVTEAKAALAEAEAKEKAGKSLIKGENK